MRRLPTEYEGDAVLYNNDLEKVDLLVGMFSEPLPKGFALVTQRSESSS
jgi:hypothetical protein